VAAKTSEYLDPRVPTIEEQNKLVIEKDMNKKAWEVNPKSLNPKSSMALAATF
jgi:hypothetical protein